MSLADLLKRKKKESISSPTQGFSSNQTTAEKLGFKEPTPTVLTKIVKRTTPTPTPTVSRTSRNGRMSSSTKLRLEAEARMAREKISRDAEIKRKAEEARKRAAEEFKRIQEQKRLEQIKLENRLRDERNRIIRERNRIRELGGTTSKSTSVNQNNERIVTTTDIINRLVRGQRYDLRVTTQENLKTGELRTITYKDDVQTGGISNYKLSTRDLSNIRRELPKDVRLLVNMRTNEPVGIQSKILRMTIPYTTQGLEFYNKKMSEIDPRFGIKIKERIFGTTLKERLKKASFEIKLEREKLRPIVKKEKVDIEVKQTKIYTDQTLGGAEMLRLQKELNKERRKTGQKELKLIALTTKDLLIKGLLTVDEVTRLGLKGSKEVILFGKKLADTPETRQKVWDITKQIPKFTYDVATGAFKFGKKIGESKEERQKIVNQSKIIYNNYIKPSVTEFGHILKTSPNEAALLVGSEILIMKAFGAGFRVIGGVSKGTTKVLGKTLSRRAFLRTAIRLTGKPIKFISKAGSDFLSISKSTVLKASLPKVTKPLKTIVTSSNTNAIIKDITKLIPKSASSTHVLHIKRYAKVVIREFLRDKKTIQELVIKFPKKRTFTINEIRNIKIYNSVTETISKYAAKKFGIKLVKPIKRVKLIKRLKKTKAIRRIRKLTEKKKIAGVKVSKKTFKDLQRAKELQKRLNSGDIRLIPMGKGASVTETFTPKTLTKLQLQYWDIIKTLPSTLFKNVNKIKVTTFTEKYNYPTHKITRDSRRKIFEVGKVQNIFHNNSVSISMFDKSGRGLGTLTFNTISKKPIQRFRTLSNALKYGRGKNIVISKQVGSDFVKSYKLKRLTKTDYISKIKTDVNGKVTKLDVETKMVPKDIISKKITDIFKLSIPESKLESTITKRKIKERLLKMKGKVELQFEREVDHIVSQSRIAMGKDKAKALKLLESRMRASKIVKKIPKSLIITLTNKKIKRLIGLKSKYIIQIRRKSKTLANQLYKLRSDVTLSKGARKSKLNSQIRRLERVKNNLFSDTQTKLGNIEKQIAVNKNKIISEEIRLGIKKYTPMRKISQGTIVKTSFKRKIQLIEQAGKRVAEKESLAGVGIKAKPRKVSFDANKMKKALTLEKQLKRAKLSRRLSRADRVVLNTSLLLARKLINQMKSGTLNLQQSSTQQLVAKINSSAQLSKSTSVLKTASVLKTLFPTLTLRVSPRGKGVERVTTEKKKKIRLPFKKKKFTFEYKTLSKPVLVYKVVAKRRGKIVTLLKDLTNIDANNFLSYELDNQLLRTGRKVLIGKKKRVIRLPGKYSGYYNKNRKKLRAYKIKQGKKKRISSLIEKKKFIGDTKGEVLQLISSRKRKAVRAALKRKLKSKKASKAAKTIRKKKPVKKRKTVKRGRKK